MVKFNKAFLTELKTSFTTMMNNMSKDSVVELIQFLNYHYYNKGQSKVSDDVYDMIIEHMRKMDKNHPILSHVGAVISSDDLRKEKLPFYMGSMDKIKGLNTNSLESFKNKHSSSFLISDKLDGVSALYHVAKGEKPKLYSRGDGRIGQNISHLIPFIKSLQREDIGNFKEITIRGELIMNKNNFENVKDKGANARNMVAGLVNAKTPDLRLFAFVEFRAYELVHEGRLQIHNRSPEEQFVFMIRNGFQTAYNLRIEGRDLTVDLLSKLLLKRRQESDFEIDGLIVADNHHHIPINGKNPSYAFAFKSIITQETAEVVVTNVSWNISKDKYYIPVVEFDPVQISGVSIKRATGFNGEFIFKNKIGPGARVVITRSGDVIPFIQKVLKPADSGIGQMPKEPYEWTTTNKDIIASENSSGSSLKTIENFFDVVDIKGISNKTIEKLFNSGFLTIESILKAKQVDFDKVDGLLNRAVFHDKIHSKLRDIDCVTLMQASNAFGRGFGKRRLTPIISKFPEILTNNSFKPSIEDLVQIEGVSVITANAFITGLKEFRIFSKSIEKIISSCNANNTNNTNNANNTKNKKQKPNSQPNNKLANEKIVFSGFRDKQLEEKATSLGADVGAAVTGKTTMIVAKDPDATSGKLIKAKEKGVKILSRDEFVKLMSV